MMADSKFCKTIFSNLCGCKIRFSLKSCFKIVFRMMVLTVKLVTYISQFVQNIYKNMLVLRRSKSKDIEKMISCGVDKQEEKFDEGEAGAHAEMHCAERLKKQNFYLLLQSFSRPVESVLPTFLNRTGSSIVVEWFSKAAWSRRYRSSFQIVTPERN